MCQWKMQDIVYSLWPRLDIYLPFHFSYGKCTIWDSLVTSGSVGQNKCDSTQNECTAKHADPHVPCFPTELTKPGVIEVNINNSILKIDDDSDDESAYSHSVLSGYPVPSDVDDSKPAAEQPPQDISLNINDDCQPLEITALQVEVGSPLRAQLTSAKSALFHEQESPKHNS
jgi:hypothetical protein